MPCHEAFERSLSALEPLPLSCCRLCPVLNNLRRRVRGSISEQVVPKSLQSSLCRMKSKHPMCGVCSSLVSLEYPSGVYQPSVCLRGTGVRGVVRWQRAVAVESFTFVGLQETIVIPSSLCDLSRDDLGRTFMCLSRIQPSSAVSLVHASANLIW